MLGDWRAGRPQKVLQAVSLFRRLRFNYVVGMILILGGSTTKAAGGSIDVAATQA